MNDMHAPNLTSPSWGRPSERVRAKKAGWGERSGYDFISSEFCAMLGPLPPPAFARASEQGCRAEAHRAKAGCCFRELRLAKPGSPLRYRARGSPTSPQGGGKFERCTTIREPPVKSDLLHFEDFEPGQVFAFGTRVIRAEEMIAFAREFDPQPQHTDPD